MAAPITTDDLVVLVRRSGLVEPARLDAFLHQAANADLPRDRVRKLARRLVKAGLLTNFQGAQLLLGRWRGFTVGGYRILEHLGADDLGSFFLCAEVQTGAQARVHVLLQAAADAPLVAAQSALEGFTAAGLDDPHLPGPAAVAREGRTLLVVTPYIDGSSLGQIVQRKGPLDPVRAAHYVRQAALGLQRLHEAGLVHGAIQPYHLLLDRRGVVRIINLGLIGLYDRLRRAASRNEAAEDFAGLAFRAPEQLRAAEPTDIRADVFGLGASFWYLLAGQPPPAPAADSPGGVETLRFLRPDVSEELVAVVVRMTAPEPAARFPVPAEVVAALAPWTREPIPPPPADEMPDYCPALRRDYLPAAPPPLPSLDDLAALLEEPPPPGDERPYYERLEDDITLGAAETEEEVALAAPHAETSEDIDVMSPLPEEEGGASDVPSASAERPAPAPTVKAPPAPTARRRSAPAARPQRTRPAPTARPKEEKPAVRPQPPAARPLGKTLALLLALLLAAVPIVFGMTRLVRSWFGDAPAPPASADQPTSEREVVLEGAVEAADAERVTGWAWDRKHPDEAVVVDVYDGITLLGSVRADIYRQDLHARGLGDGKHVFYFALPAGLHDGQEHRLRVLFGGTPTELAHSPQVIAMPAR